MEHIFTSRNDIRRYAAGQLERYDASQYNCSHDELIDRLTDGIANAAGFSYGDDMSDMLQVLYESSGEWADILE